MSGATRRDKTEKVRDGAGYVGAGSQQAQWLRVLTLAWIKDPYDYRQGLVTAPTIEPLVSL